MNSDTTFEQSVNNILAESKTARSSRLRKTMTKILSSCPNAGSGVHHWLFVTALKLHRYCPAKEELAELLTLGSSACGRDVTEQEIWDAISNSQSIAEGTSPGVARRKWPERNGEAIEAIVRGGPDMAQLESSSPVRWNDGKPHTEEIIDALFPGNPLLCAAQEKTASITCSREEWRGLMAQLQFVVPSPMTSLQGNTKAGRASVRSLDNTGPRRFLVVEFDKGPFDEHAAMLAHLAKFAPLVLAVHSGNKSAHGWFFCAGQPEEKIECFFRYAVSLGADRATWTRCQFVRMPDGQRDNGNRQRVMYFNPQLLEAQ